MSLKTHKYRNDSITIVWKPEPCIHSAMCFKGLSAVFDPRRTPWIQMDKASTEKIIEIVKKFPSGALSYFINEEKIVPDASIFNSLNPIILF